MRKKYSGQFVAVFVGIGLFVLHGIANADEPKSTAKKSESQTAESGKRRLTVSSAVSDEPSKEQLEREKAFGELMSGATLEGHFTAGSKRDDGKLGSPEKYTLGKVTKFKDDLWTFETRIQYGQHDVKLPLTIRVVWSGDTPVITLDKFAVPGFGTFTCRVMIFNKQYAGMWDGGNHGGLMFGKVVKAEKKEVDAKPSDKSVESKK